MSDKPFLAERAAMRLYGASVSMDSAERLLLVARAEVCAALALYNEKGDRDMAGMVSARLGALDAAIQVVKDLARMAK